MSRDRPASLNSKALQISGESALVTGGLCTVSMTKKNLSTSALYAIAVKCTNSEMSYNFKCNGRAKVGLSFFGTTSRARR